MTTKPNFLIIVADDLGFTDLEPFGGEIVTPNLAALAKRGLRFTDFHTALACLPTRLMLFTGTDNHIAGLGQMREFVNRPGFKEKLDGKPGYEGYLNDRVVALPELLHDAGYYTWLSGKWHLGLLKEYWPSTRGFEKLFALLPGAGNHYKYLFKGDDKFLPPLYTLNGEKFDAHDLPLDFYSTKYFTDRGLEFLADKEERKGRPFFGCLTYTAPHWPYQAPPERVAKYAGKYDGGPEELRRKRLEAAIKAGVVPAGVEPHPVSTHRDKLWAELLEDERRYELRVMETYAAMVEIMDEQIGRVVQQLKDAGEFDNTFVLFMLDNGAEGLIMEALPLGLGNVRDVVKNNYDNLYENVGRYNSFVWYSDQWAQAATAPLLMYKMWALEGGIRCPLIVSYPPLVDAHTIAGPGLVVNAFNTVMDITPTVLELAGVPHPGTTYQGRTVAEPRGALWVSFLKGKGEEIHAEDHVTGWELFGQQAVRQGHYKALYVPKPFGPAKWQLFDLRTDLGENHDLAALHPEVLAKLMDHWALYVAETGLIELGDTFPGNLDEYKPERPVYK